MSTSTWLQRRPLGTRGAAVRGVDPLPLGMPGRRTVVSGHQSGHWTIVSVRQTVVLPQTRSQYMILCVFYCFCDQRSRLCHLVYRPRDICSSNLPITVLVLHAFPCSNDAAHCQAIFTVSTNPCMCHRYCWLSSSHWLWIRLEHIATTSGEFIADVADG